MAHLWKKHNTFMKTLFSVGAALVLLWGAAPAEAVKVTFGILDNYIEVGEAFNVEVWSNGEGIGQELLAFGFNVGVTPGIYFTYTGYTMGGDFLDDSLSFPPDVAGSTFPGIPDDDVLLATLSFDAIAAGKGTLSVEGNDELFQGLFYESGIIDILAEADITVNPATVPEPGTLLLLGSGLAGLAGLKRKRLFWKT